MANRPIGTSLFRAGAPIRDGLSWAASRSQSQLCRCFSVSATRQAQHAISFTKTSSPELDEVLASVHRLIILPSYLPKEQQKKLYDPKHDMRADPITMELDGEVIRFPHIDMFKDLPDSRKILHKAVRLMRTRGDWVNLPRLLEGLHGAQRKLRRSDSAGLVARAGYNGEIYQIIEAARTVQRTGFSLRHPEVSNELLLQIQLKAIDSGYAEQSTRRALLWAEMVLAMLEDDAHKFTAPHHRRKHQEVVQMHREPHLLAARLHLAAAVAANHTGMQDADGKVAKYGHVLAALWPAGSKLRDLRPSEAYGVRASKHHQSLVDANQRLAVCAPIVKGLRLSVEVLSKSDQQELADKLAAMLPALEEEMAECRKIAVDGGAVAGPRMHEKLFGQTESRTEVDADV